MIGSSNAPAEPRLPRGRLALIAVVGLALASLLSPLWAPEDVAATSLDVGLSGHRALTEVLERAGTTVGRWRRAHGSLEGTRGTLVMLEPLPELLTDRDADLAALDAWVAQGNTLVLTPLQRRPAAVAVAGLPMEVTWDEPVEGLPEPVLEAFGLEIGWAALTHGDAATWETVEGAALGGPVTLSLHDRAVLWDTSGEMEVLAVGEAGAMLGRIPWGEGAVVLSATSEPFRNLRLAEADNAFFALTALSLEPTEAVWFDEGPHGLVAYPSLMHILTAPPLLLATLHLGALVALCLWAWAPRFGALREAPAPSRRRKREHFEAVAALLTEGGHLRFAVEQLSQGLQREVASQVGLEGAADPSRIAAVLRQRDPALAARFETLLADGLALGAGRGLAEGAVVAWGARWNALRREILDG